VKDLWTVASPCEERISLHELRGQTLAVDLAGWVVQNQTVQGMSHVTRPHLRNLVFRSTTLLNLDILPVFVLDGEPPAVKSATVAARNQLNWGSSQRPKTNNLAQSPKVQKRRQFTGILQECKRLLVSLGAPVVTAPGEAEAFCAALDRAGLVDGVISDDSDSLCYGAKVVYRNFSTDPKHYYVSKYSAKRLRREIGISRERIVIMSLILGCDYSPGGVYGVGKENLIKLFQLWGQPSRGELDQVVGWNEELAVEVKKQAHCGTCGHPGTVGNHRKTGCPYCPGSCEPGTPCPCEYHSPEHQRLLAEAAVRNKAVESPGWPHPDIVKEFYSLDEQRMDISFKWKSPTPSNFIQICVGRMGWAEEYSREKIEGIVTRWQVRNPGVNIGLTPETVVKTRVQGGQSMLEIEWVTEMAGLNAAFVACVPTSDFEKAYPELLNAFIEAKEAKKKKKKPTKKDKENKAPTKRNVAAKPKATKGKEAAQPAITNFMKPLASKIAQQEFRFPDIDPESEVLDLPDMYPEPEMHTTPRADATPDLRPKNLLLKKINIGTKYEHITAARLVTPPVRLPTKDVLKHKFENSVDTPDIVPDVVTKRPVVQERLSDVFTLKECLGHLNLDTEKEEKKQYASPSLINDTDIQQYLDETYNSEISGIIDDIIYLPDSSEKHKSGTNPDLDLTKQFQFMSIKTSTPHMLGRQGRAVVDSDNSSKHSSSAELSAKSDVSSPSLRNPSTDKEKSAKSRDGNFANSGANSSDDEFDFEVSKCTPLMERVKRRLEN